MSKWIMVDDAMLDDPFVQLLAPETFKDAVLEAMQGQPSMVSAFVRGPYSRPLAHEWRVIRAAIFERDNYTCTYCGAHGVPLECDHIVPVSKGGGSDADNLTTACRTCNQSKRDKLLEEWKRG